MVQDKHFDSKGMNSGIENNRTKQDQDPAVQTLSPKAPSPTYGTHGSEM